MTILSFDNVACKTVVHAHARFEAGSVTVLGGDAAGLDELVALAAGERAPQRGLVLVEGSPATVPSARARVAALRASESLAEARNVEAALDLVLAARGLELSPRSLLASWELESLARRKVTELSPSEQRLLSLVVGLSDARARVLALYEPLATPLPRERVLDALAERARSAVVLSATASLDDARALGGSWFVLGGGVLAAPGHDPFALGSGTRKAFLVRASDARKLASLLAADSAISGVDWDERRAARELTVHGPDAPRLCLAVSRVALEHAIDVELIVPLVPPLEAVLAARSGLVQSAYESAYRAAQGQAAAAPAPPAPEPAPGVPPIFGGGYGSSEYRSLSAPAPEVQSVSLNTSPDKEREP